MTWRPSGLRPTRLVAMFVAAALLPALALGWLGWQLVEKDRLLERQRVQDLVESTANSVTATIERDLGAIDRDLGSDAVHETAVDSITVRLTRAGTATPIAGAPLLFTLSTPVSGIDPSDSTWSEAEQHEFADGDLPGAIRIYRSLGQSTSPDIRAGALVRLARTLKRSGRHEEALAAYAAMARLTSARVLGDPADLFGRWARTDLLQTWDPEGVRDEARALAADLIAGNWTLDRTTFLAYADPLSPWWTPAERADLDQAIGLSDAVAAFSNDWQSPSTALPGNGRQAVRIGADDILVVWRATGDAVLLFAATPAYVGRMWQKLWTAGAISVALIDHERLVAGNMPAAGLGPLVNKPPSETHLPWTIRVAATSTPDAIAASGAVRRRILAAVLLIFAFLIPAVGYLVLRAVNGELSLAREQSAFVSAVSHEFRSPLTSLLHLTSLLRSDFQPTNERRRQYYDALAHETERLRRFVDTLLDFGRIQAGAVRYHLVPVDVAPVVSGVVDEFRRHASSASHEVSLVVAPSVPRVPADVEALGRALWNLLENAAKYSPSDRPITVRVEEDQQRVAIRVTDHGPGIPDAERPRIFDQFFRGAAAAESAIKGTGVGLAVVRHIVHGHGGRIDIDSTLGVGSTFNIVLPAVHDESASERRVS